MIEQRLPAWSQRTARRELVIDESVHTTRSSIGCASNGATPSAGTVTATAKLPSVRRWPPSTSSASPSSTTTPSTGTSAGLASDRPCGAISASSPAMRASRSSATRAKTASASAWTQAIDDPGRMSWNCWVSTSRQSSSTSARPAERRRPQLGLDEQALAPTVAELGAELAGQRAAVGLEVELAAPHGHRRPGADLAPRRASKNSSGVPTATVTRASVDDSRRARSSISRVGPPPPSPWPNGISDTAAPAVVLEVAGRVGDLGRGDLGVVGVDRREVGEHPRAVEALPPERVVREPVLLVPRELLGDEPPHSGRPRTPVAAPPDSRTRRGSRPRSHRWPNFSSK